MSDESLLIFNAKIYTRHFPQPTSLLIENGVITWLGTDAASLAFENTQRIDAKGFWIAPAFVDAHVHLTNTGLLHTGCDLTGVQSWTEMFTELAQQNSQEVCIAHGWDDTHWQAYSSVNIQTETLGPIYASRIDVHSAYLSPRFIAMCPEVNEADGFADSGIVTGQAHHVARKFALSLLNESQISESQRSALHTAASRGIAVVHEMAGPDISGVKDAENLKKFNNENFPEVVLWWGELNGHQTASELGAFGCGGDLFVDGSVGSQTAHLCDPYESGGHGNQYQNTDALAEHIQACVENSLASGFHAIGDAALDSVIDAYERCFNAVGEAKFRSVSHQIEHAEMLSSTNIARMSALGITASMQPVFDELWAGEGQMYDSRLGDRWTDMNDFAEITRSGVLMSFGSDSPVTPIDPWRAIKAAENPHQATHGVSRRAAFAAHTRSSFRAMRRHDCGEIEIGMRANIAMWEVSGLEVKSPDHVVRNWSTDPRSATPPLPALDEVTPTCLATLRNGSVIYSNGTIFQ